MEVLAFTCWGEPCASPWPSGLQLLLASKLSARSLGSPPQGEQRDQARQT